MNPDFSIEYSITTFQPDKSAIASADNKQHIRGRDRQPFQPNKSAIASAGSSDGSNQAVLSVPSGAMGQTSPANSLLQVPLAPKLKTRPAPAGDLPPGRGGLRGRVKRKAAVMGGVFTSAVTLLGSIAAVAATHQAALAFAGVVSLIPGIGTGIGAVVLGAVLVSAAIGVIGGGGTWLIMGCIKREGGPGSQQPAPLQHRVAPQYSVAPQHPGAPRFVQPQGPAPADVQQNRGAPPRPDVLSGRHLLAEHVESAIAEEIDQLKLQSQAGLGEVDRKFIHTTLYDAVVDRCRARRSEGPHVPQKNAAIEIHEMAQAVTTATVAAKLATHATTCQASAKLNSQRAQAAAAELLDVLQTYPLDVENLCRVASNLMFHSYLHTVARRKGKEVASDHINADLKKFLDSACKDPKASLALSYLNGGSPFRALYLAPDLLLDAIPEVRGPFANSLSKFQETLRFALETLSGHDKQVEQRINWLNDMHLRDTDPGMQNRLNVKELSELADYRKNNVPRDADQFPKAEEALLEHLPKLVAVRAAALRSPESDRRLMQASPGDSHLSAATYSTLKSQVTSDPSLTDVVTHRENSDTDLHRQRRDFHQVNNQADWRGKNDRDAGDAHGEHK